MQDSSVKGWDRSVPVSHIVRMGDDDEPAVERLPGWVCLIVDTLAALMCWLLIGVGLRAAWCFWRAMP